MRKSTFPPNSRFTSSVSPFHIRTPLWQMSYLCSVWLACGLGQAAVFDRVMSPETPFTTSVLVTHFTHIFPAGRASNNAQSIGVHGVTFKSLKSLFSGLSFGVGSKVLVFIIHLFLLLREKLLFSQTS